MGGYLSHFLTRSLKEVFHHTIESSSKNIEFLDDEKIPIEFGCFIKHQHFSISPIRTAEDLTVDVSL